MSERYAVIGHPVGHSLSPFMQRAAFDQAAIAATYQALDIAPEALPSWVGEGADDLAGFNVTIPHKRAITPLLADLTEDARATGAVNTVARESNALVGHNTDVEGFDRALAAFGEVCGGEALVLGAGGAASAVVRVLDRRGYRVWVAARRPESAQSLVAPERAVDLTATRVLDLVASADVLVNATPLGMDAFPGLSPLPPHVEPQIGTIAIDLVYGRQTPFLEIAKRTGCRTQDGLEMLVHQGAAAFRFWTGREPDIDVMRAACTHRLEVACFAS
ncbi:MAG TPA: shikimate dehydrogenase [Chloroflexota bacterium]|nr:shikimate dehydrogenase [Chloroflexota bacterium]